MSKVTKGQKQNVENYKTEKCWKLQKAEKGGKIQYSKGKIRGKLSPRRIKKVAKNSPRFFLLVNSVEKNNISKITKSLIKKLKLKII
jgi:hypothetical protein